VKRVVIISIIVSFCLMFFVPLSYSQSKGTKSFGTPASSKDKSSMKKSTAASKHSKKIQDFLNTIEKARSIDEIGKSFRKSNFSKRELSQLEPLLKKPPYSTKLRDIEKKGIAAAKKRSKAKAKKIEKQRSQKLQKQKKQRLVRLNQQAKTALQTLKIDVPVQSRVNLQGQMRAASVPDSVVEAVAGDRFENLLRIRSISPRPVVAGQRMTLSGENFGGTPGTVTLRLNDGSTTWNIRCSVDRSRWRDNQIIATPPEWLKSWAGETNKDVRIFVRNDQGGAYMEAQLGPDPATLQPEITRLSRSTIEPGQIIVIEGRNFLQEHRGSVEFRFGSRTFAGIIEDWGPNYISVKLPEDIEGMQTTDGIAKVTNHRRYNTTRSITFEPTLATHTYHRDYYIHCHAWSLGFLGDKKEITLFNYDLINRWKVKEAWMEVDPHGRGGARYLVRPEVGSTRAHSRVEIWAEAFSSTDLDEYIMVEGPRGLRARD